MKYLTRKSKKIVILSFSLIGLLIIASIFILIFWPHSGLRTSTPLILVVVMLFAIFAAVFIIIFIIARRRNVSYLKDDYYEAYESISAALENSTLSIFEKRETLLDISDLLFQAQENNRPLSSVIENKNILGFIEKIKQSYGYRNTILFNILNGIQNFVFVLTVVQLSIFLIRGTDPFFKVTLGLSILPAMFLLSFILLPLVRYLLSRQKILWSIVSIFGFLVVDFGFNSLLKNFFMDSTWVQIYFQKEITFISSWTIAVIIILIMMVSWFLKWFIRYRSLKR